MADDHHAPLTISLEFVRARRSDDAFGFDSTPQTYIVRGGVGSPSVEVAWDGPLRADLAAVSRKGVDPAIVQRLGDALRRILLPAGWDRHARAIAGARERGRPVRVEVCSAAAEIYALPWELLTLEEGGRHLGEVADVLVQYSWPKDHMGEVAADEQPRPEGGRILFAWSAAGGGVPAAAHQRELAAAAAEGLRCFDPETDVLAHASLARLGEAIREAAAGGRPFTALHLLCHGGRRGATVGLWLEGDDGDKVLVDPADLRRVLPRLPLVVLAACSAGDPGELGNHLGSAAQSLHRAGCEAVVCSRFPLSVPGSIALTQVLYRGVLVELLSVEQAVQRARAALARDPNALDWAGLQVYSRPDTGDTWPVVVRPYRGLLSFQHEHRRLFFGREQKVAELVGRLTALQAAKVPRMLVVAGASGSGKSSLVMAGVGPRLLAESGTELIPLRPGQAPLQALRTRLAARESAGRPCLLVVDQLEELFTHVAGERASEREAFARELWRLAGDPDGVFSVLATLRVDFIGACGDLVLDERGARLDQIACDKEHGVLLAQMGPDDLRAAIERPAVAVGLSFDQGLLDQILSDFGNSPAGLPLLAYALDGLWVRRRGRTLTRAAYAAMGGVTGALRSHAEELFGRLDEGTLRLVRKLFTRMVSASGGGAGHTRRRVLVEAIRPRDPRLAPRLEAVVDQLVEARLVVRGTEAGAATLELAHEALILRWDRLEAWLREDAEMLGVLAELRECVRAWKQHKTLLVGHQLARAAVLSERFGDELEGDMHALIAASTLAAQRRTRRRQIAFVVAVVAAVLLAVLAVVAWSKASEASRAEDVAAERARVAEAAEREAARAARSASEAVMLAAARLAVTDPLAQGLLLRDISEPVRLRGWLAAAIALIDGGPPPAPIAGHDGTIRAVAFSGDGAWVATASDDRTVRLSPTTADGATAPALPDSLLDGWLPFGRAGAEGPGREAVVLEHPAIVLDVAVDRDASRIVTVAGDRTVRTWRRDAPRSPVPLQRAPLDVERVALGPDGGWVVAVGRSAPVMWRTDGSGAPVGLRCPEGQVVTTAGQVEVAWSRDGRRVAASCPGSLAVWEVDRPGAPLRLPESEGGARVLRFSPDDRGLAAVSPAGEVLRWQLEEGEARVSRPGRGIEVGWESGGGVVPFTDGASAWALSSPDGALVLGVSEAGDVSVLGSAGGSIRRLRGPPIGVQARSGGRVPAAWRPDGRAVAVAGRDHTLRIWSLELDDPPAWVDRRRPVLGAAFHPSEERVMLRRRRSIEVAEVEDGTTVAELALAGREFIDAAWSPDGARIAALTRDRDVVFWTYETERVEVDGALRGLGAAPPLAWSRAGDALVTLTAATGPARAEPATEALVWRLSEAPRAFACVGAAVRRAELSPDGATLALGCSDGVVLLEPLAGGERRVLPSRDGAVQDLGWSPDGERLAVAHADRLARVWRRDGRGDPMVLRGHTERVTSVTWHPTGRSLLTASDDDTGRIWTAQGRLLRSGEGHAGDVLVARFSPEGARALSASADGTGRIWSLADEPIVLGRSGSAVVDALWAPDGRRALTLDAEGGARIHLVGHELVGPWFTRHVRGCLSVEQRGALLGEREDVARMGRDACVLVRGEP